MNTYNVYYMKPDWFGKFSFGPPPTVEDLPLTHTYLMFVLAEDLEEVFHDMQGENWSPNGEARSLIKSKGLEHTSMSVGDVVQDITNKKYYVVAGIGFKEIT